MTTTMKLLDIFGKISREMHSMNSSSRLILLYTSSNALLPKIGR